jgi:hypothetical protein
MTTAAVFGANVMWLCGHVLMLEEREDQYNQTDYSTTKHQFFHVNSPAKDALYTASTNNLK